ncbi:PREDICTED: kaptin-like [Acropora digitifera]|uniref:kaptin-like n=1 Tax=Acropora digitifera TaxID=70779 RepID=UPI00077AE571|nr:PREDICTED: kaptin-like [Acropora digitifera]
MADEEKEIVWEEIHFSPIPSQTNIYGLTKVEGREEGNKVFLASLSGRVICLEYQQNWLVPSAREVPFTYIPGSKEFSHCYLRQPHRSCYHSSEGCQHFELDFVPFQLTHAEIFVKGRKEVVFLLCGSDQNVHMFFEDRVQQRFEEQPVADYFPELQNLASNVLWLEVQTYQSRRITVLGCQDGHVKLAVTELTEQPSVIKEYSLNRDGPISSVKLFSLNPGQAHKTGSIWIFNNFLFQEILVYKCVVTSANNVDFTLIWRRSFANPLFAVEYLDLTNDGVKEIAVASLAGLHVLQIRHM